MLLGEYSDRPGGGGATLPHVVVLSITRAARATSTRDFVVTVHEEGTAIAWSSVVRIDADDEAFVLDAVRRLHRRSLDESELTATQAKRLAVRLGKTLYQMFVGRAGTVALKRVRPTAVMLAVDETLLSLPWELMPGPDGDWLAEVPVGRIVTTGLIPARGRDPKIEDPVVRILVVANPTGDLDAATAEAEAIAGLEGTHGDVKVKVVVLPTAKATPAALRVALRDDDFDVLHVAGHGAFSSDAPGDSALALAGGRLSADDVARLRWKAPPYIVFNSACESARAVRGRRLVSRGGRANGLAAAFLAAGCEAYIGHFWPVDDWSAATFATTFYEALFRRVNVGGAVLEARQAVLGDFSSRGLLTGPGSVFVGDAGSAERRDLARAA
ncbi:MAG TPA: CHAT domain-containing protein [Microthrixaceae bacterium]|nr:CHAT domain-containing protein [Microthrixaceae bacterium]